MVSEPQPSKDLVKADERKDQQPIGRAVKLPTWQRVLAGGLGTAGGFAGIWAIIVSGKDGAGSVALIIAAIVFWIIALVGVIPYKLWGKDMGYELGLPPELADKVVEALPPEVVAEVAASSPQADARAEYSSMRRAAASQVDRNDHLRSVVVGVAEMLRAEGILSEVQLGSWEIVKVTGSEGHEVVIHYKASDGISMRDMLTIGQVAGENTVGVVVVRDNFIRVSDGRYQKMFSSDWALGLASPNRAFSDEIGSPTFATVREAVLKALRYKDEPSAT